MSKMKRQRQIESDSVRDGCVRWCQNTEYLEATDTKALWISEIFSARRPYFSIFFTRW
jgi:hypothetical protein